jgi:hypothetical protein
MMDASSCWRRMRHVLGLGMAGLLLASCGGGGGDGSAPPGSIDVTAANQDTLVRAGVIAIQGDVIVGAVGAVSSSGRATSPLQAGRKRAAAVNPPVVENCFYSGTVTRVLDDRDNSGSETVGDVQTSTYNDCVEMAGDTGNGTITETYTRYDSSALTFGSNVTTSNFSSVSSARRATLQGDFSLLLQFTAGAGSTARIQVGNSLVFGIVAPSFSDTVTLRAGYTMDSVDDSTVVPPGGGTTTGLTSTTASGQVASASAAGYVLVRTLQPMLQYDVDTSPRSGQFEVVGRTGSLRATVLSTTQVRIDLDADGDGVFEGSKVVRWSDLF